MADTLEKKEAQFNEVLAASNLDPTALSAVTRKLEVRFLTFMKFKLLYLCYAILSYFERHVASVRLDNLAISQDQLAAAIQIS